jgi:hypothetical protein
MTVFLLLAILHSMFITPAYSDDCHGRAFNEFAYRFDEAWHSDLMPDEAWEPVSKIIWEFTDIPVSDRVFIQPLLINQRKLWLGNTDAVAIDHPTLFRFDIETNLWDIITPYTEKGFNRIFSIFADRRGQVWGVTDNPNAILARFDVESQKFVDIQHLPIDSPPDWPPHVVVVEDDFWIFTHSGAIYRYSYQETELVIEKQPVELPFTPSDVLYYPDGYFVVLMYANSRIDGRIHSDELVQFHVDQQTLTPMGLPDDWPSGFMLKIDADGNVWIGASGFRTPSGEWTLIHPDPEYYFSGFYNQSARPPKLNFISSDGRFWFDKYVDMGYLYEGTAWYDPATGEGCMFTTYPSRVREDEAGGLWIFVNGTLMRSSVLAE